MDKYIPDEIVGETAEDGSNTKIRYLDLRMDPNVIKMYYVFTT